MARAPAILALALALLTGACSLAPAYHVPETATVPAFKEAGPWAPAVPADSGADRAADGAWWTVFGDPVLNGLEARVTADNPTYAGALARYDAARAYLGQARSSLFPSIGLNANVTDNRQSDNRPLRGSNQPDLYPADTLGGSLDFELDLWGRVRNHVAAGKAEVAASGDDLAAIRLSLASGLAEEYFALRGADQQIVLLTTTVDAYARADALTRRRYRGGIASGIDTGRSGAQLADAQAQLADVRASRALAEHAVASLAGLPASTFSIAPVSTDVPIPTVPTGLPSTLLQRRPDVAAAERRVAAANAGIGVARAAFFPTIGLGGSGGFQNTGLADLVTAPNLFWSIGPSTVLNLFDGGRRRADLAAARAHWAEATADYRGRVLQAFQDVEDGLSQLHHLGDEAEAQDRAAAMAAQTERLSLNRYTKGAVSFLDVVTAQTTALNARRAAIALHTRRLRESVRLIRAIGGGWNENAIAAK